MFFHWQAFPAYSLKCSSLVWKFVNYERKKFYNIWPRKRTWEVCRSKGWLLALTANMALGRKYKSKAAHSNLKQLFAVNFITLFVCQTVLLLYTIFHIVLKWSSLQKDWVNLLKNFFTELVPSRDVLKLS